MITGTSSLASSLEPASGEHTRFDMTQYFGEVTQEEHSALSMTIHNVVEPQALKSPGGKHIERAVDWLGEGFQSVGEHGTSHSQGFDTLSPEEPPPSTNAAYGTDAFTETPSIITRGERNTPYPCDEPEPEAEKKGSPKHVTSKKRKKNSDPSDEGPYNCPLHKKTFSGPYAKGNYLRHLRHTKEHGCKQFKCHLCLIGMARVDHFKAHMKNVHNLKVLGRSGKYSFEDLGGADPAVDEGAPSDS